VRRAEAVDRLRERGDPTVPFSLAMEAATNPFVRAGSVAELARRRAAKDAFRG
jgi:hydroxyacylglutathione hydrolase